MSALNASTDPRFISGSSFERMGCHIDDLQAALRDLVSTVANATDINAVLRSYEYAKAQRLLAE